MRPLSRILEMGPPLMMAREVAWRMRKIRGKRRNLAQLEQRPSVTFRNIPYYMPNISTLSRTRRELLIAFADQVCEGRFPFLGYATVDLGRQPMWNVDFVSGLNWPQIPSEDHHRLQVHGPDAKVPDALA